MLFLQEKSDTVSHHLTHFNLLSCKNSCPFFVHTAINGYKETENNSCSLPFVKPKCMKVTLYIGRQNIGMLHHTPDGLFSGMAALLAGRRPIGPEIKN